MDQFLELKQFIDECSYPVFFTGAGISTDSGIPDFRGPNGFWKKNQPIYFQDFMASEEMRNKYWEQSIQFKSNFNSYQPNFGHKAIAKIIKDKNKGHCITQNIDNLHQAGGLDNDQVTEIHGNATYAVCLDCSKKFELSDIHAQYTNTKKSPTCDVCAGPVKTATISFGQPMPELEMERAQIEAESSDLFIVAGSSLVVFPAATILLYAKEKGAKLIIINNEPTEFDRFADLVINESISDTFKQAI